MSASPAHGLDGQVVVVEIAAAGAAEALAGAGATVVVIGPADQADSVGRAVADLVENGSRAVAFVGDPSRPEVAEALAELVGELFAARPASAPEPA